MTRADARRSVDAIVEAAREVLAADPAASSQSIIDRSGVHRATFYRHFPSREALADEIYDRFLVDVHAIHDRSRAVSDPAEALEQVARETIAEIERNRLFLYIAPRGVGDDSTRELVVYLHARIVEGQERGVLRTDQPADALLAAYSGLVIGMAIPPPGMAPPAEKARIAMALLRASTGPG
ncbi:MAG: TetR/AcrR family transcriptional regulator [Solirubrobacteraceae bacterium]|jgi:AcrR family transcriptional regulator|nr:TetR/AcrR family transcriptional regulator [Solirubrobacteraceae bacterium]MCU0313802.1 TetR/AcrR family transcriptional regulator [Solirubrobacteraceae bacterium]